MGDLSEEITAFSSQKKDESTMTENEDHSDLTHAEGTENDQNISNTSSTVSDNVLETAEAQKQPEIQRNLEEDDELVLSKKKLKKRAVLADSDSENESCEQENAAEDPPEIGGSPDHLYQKKFSRISRKIDSDSDDENEQKPAEIFVVDKKGNLVSEEEHSEQQQKNILSNLCDSDSSENENENDDISDNEQEMLKSNPITNSRRIIETTGHEEKQKKMTAKQALEERKEILSESQRRVRESRVSLPYHKPKPKTLKEFLQNRPKLASPLINFAQGKSPSIAIKMSKEQLEIVSHKLKEREKQIEEFYKSEDSESDEEQTINKEETTIESDVQQTELTEDTTENSNEDVRETVPNMETVEGSDENVIEAEPEALEDRMDISEQENSEEKSTEKVKIISDIPLNLGEPSTSNEDRYNLDNEIDEFQKETDYDFNLDDLNANPDPEFEPEPIKKITKKELLEKFASIQPRLSGGPNQLIELSESGSIIDDEISKLRKRFMQHNTKVETHKNNETSIISLCNGEIVKETVLLNVEHEETIVPLEKPGVRHQKLREELGAQIAQKRNDFWKEKLELMKKNEEQTSATKGGDEMDILDYEDEEEYEDLTETEDEDYLEENDCDLSEKRKKKSAFIDEEAEEESDNNDEVMETEIEENNDEVEEADEADFNENNEIEEKSRTLKRIIKPLDSDEDDDEEDGHYNVDEKKKTTYALEYESKPHNERNYPENDEFLHPNGVVKIKEIYEKSVVEPDFSTPVTYITGLKNLNESIEKDKSINDNESTNTELVSTQEVLEICSGEFPKTQATTTVSSPEITTSQLKEMFGTQSSIEFSTQDLTEICSGQFVNAKQIEPTNNKLEEAEESIISQLIDEEELKKFKKKFESPLPTNAKKTLNDFNDADEVQGGGILDSDSEDDDGELKLKLKKRNNRKKIVFTDDEEDSTDASEVEEDLNDVEYDSEENEIETPHNKEMLKAVDFLENEAELSESEWGSEDEDEKNLDELEFEKGDEDKFDEDELRSDIEKVQMRQMLDEDNREVKLLQELLLEDGELHGSGRQRQFRWKNVDGVDLNEEIKDDENGEIYLDDDETEEHWRKMRHEREIHKMKNQEDGDDELLLLESELFCNRTVKIKSQTTIQEQSVRITNQPFSLTNKRGSFLSRSEQILKKLAETSKVNMLPKNKNKIVFQALDIKVEEKKRKSSEVSDSTPKALKKIRLSGFSPATLNKKPIGSKKSLF